MSGQPQVITRFAPSPTGHLHVGGARTALFNWALAAGAKAAGGEGRFILRVEDTDQARSTEGAAKGILEDLAWLGIDWDEGPELVFEGRSLGGDPRSVGPFYQSKRLDLYNEHMDRLIDAGLAYHAFETREELDAARKRAIADKRGYRYDRAALEVDPAERKARAASGEDHVVRFRSPDEPVVVEDTVLGNVTIPADELDDFIIRKRDGFPTYHFAVVVDDALMGVTHVVRGQEHLINTPRHVMLQRALGFPTPVYAHTPLIFNPDGSKMSKRDKDKAAKAACKDQGVTVSPVEGLSAEAFTKWAGDKTAQLEPAMVGAIAAALGVELPEIEVDDFRRAGYLPDVLCNFLALLGWNPGGNRERFDRAFMAEHFGSDRIGKSNAKFDREKLRAFNQDSIAEMDDAAFLAAFAVWAERDDHELLARFTPEQLEAVCRAARPRCKTFADVRSVAGFALVPDDTIEFDGKALHKNLLKGGAKGLELLRDFRPVLAGVEPFEATAIEGAVEAFATEREVGMGKVAQPLRVAVTGTGVSPPLGETLAILGKPSVLARVDRCVEQAEAEAGV